MDLSSPTGRLTVLGGDVDADRLDQPVLVIGGD